MNVWSPSDEALLAGLGSGDALAATQFVRRFQGKVFGLALAVLGDRDAAEEVAQETFVRAWRSADAYDARRGRVASWLLAIARNLAIDAMRLRRCECVDAVEVGALLDPAAPAEERGIALHECRRLRAAMAELPAEQRRAVMLAAVHGCTAQEISEIEGVPLGTAKTRIRSALLKLRAGLEVGDD